MKRSAEAILAQIQTKEGKPGEASASHTAFAFTLSLHNPCPLLSYQPLSLLSTPNSTLPIVPALISLTLRIERVRPLLDGFLVYIFVPLLIYALHESRKSGRMNVTGY